MGESLYTASLRINNFKTSGRLVER